MFRIIRLLALPLLLALPPAAFAQSALLTSDVAMDITGKDATDARAQAMEKAELEGFSSLLDRLAADKKETILKVVDSKRVSPLVRGVEVLDEKIAGNRYRATLRVSYDALSVNSLIEAASGKDGPMVAARSTAVLVIPIYEEGGPPQLWEKDNAWRAAWQRVGVEARGGNIIVPYGDNKDAAEMDVRSAPAANYAAYSPLIERYGASELAILTASYTATPKPTVTVTRRLLNAERDDSLSLEYTADAQEDRDALLKRVAADISEQLSRGREDLLARRAMDGNISGRQLIIIPMNRLNSWTSMRQKLSGLSVVVRVEMLAISPEQVDAMVHYRGSPEALEGALTGARLRVQKTGNYWVVSRD